MTLEEAIKSLSIERNIIESMIDYNRDFEPKNPCERLKERLESINLAIKAIEEIQQYRKIGTVEECHEAREKQKAKRPKHIWDGTTECPECAKRLLRHYDFCPKCGQAIRWEN